MALEIQCSPTCKRMKLGKMMMKMARHVFNKLEHQITSAKTLGFIHFYPCFVLCLYFQQFQVLNEVDRSIHSNSQYFHKTLLRLINNNNKKTIKGSVKQMKVLFEVFKCRSVIQLASHIQRIGLSINQGERIHL